jgi:exonuclease III
LKVVALDFSGIASPGRHYVGLRRLTLPDNVFIIDFAPDKILTSEKVKTEMARLCESKQVQLSVPNLTNEYPRVVTIVVHNGRSLHAHIPKVRADVNFKAADFIMHSETRACARDPDEFYQISGFNFSRADAERLDTGEIRPYHDAGIHFREGLDSQCKKVHSGRDLDILEQSFGTVLPSLGELTLISIYRSKQFVSIVQFCEHLRPVLESVQGKRVVIAGDFNVDLLHHSLPAQALFKLMQSYGFKQHVEVHIHKYGALIDHVWTNLSPSFSVSTGVFVSYWSDHSPIWCRIGQVAVVDSSYEAS